MRYFIQKGKNEGPAGKNLFPAGVFENAKKRSNQEIPCMLEELFTLFSGEHYLSIMLILILSCILWGRNMLSERVRQDSLWVTIISCTLLVFQDILENYAQLDAARRTLRLFTSIVGYSLRPVAVLGFLLTVWPVNYKRWQFWLPVVLNALLYATALFMPLTFSFDENYIFQRGPLNGTAFVICILYLILTLIILFNRFRDMRSGDNGILYLCTLGCLGAAFMDIFLNDSILVPALLISSLTFYQFLRTQDTDHDSLTRLWNRMTFYEDCKKMKNAVSAVASIDMNGLKEINDSRGHEAGDRALRMISLALRRVMNRKVLAYRIGGDEFMVLFLNCGDKEIAKALERFQDEISQTGLSVSIGVAKRQQPRYSLDELIRSSDRQMYEEKRSYYQIHNRRKRN